MPEDQADKMFLTDLNNPIENLDVIDICRDLYSRNSNYIFNKYWVIREISIYFLKNSLYKPQPLTEK